MSLNFLFSGSFNCSIRVTFKDEGGGYKTSIVNLYTFSINSGIRYESKDEDVSKHGLVLTSINQG